jgi:Lon protease-like protein
MDIVEIDWHRAVPLLPLPNCVLFPGVVQPLHIFEPRYKQMISEALDGSGLVAIALLKEGWEQNYNGTPAVHAMTCVGKIIAHERLEDGRFNLLLHGLARGRIVREEMRGLYRRALMETVEPAASDAPPKAAMQLQQKVLRELFSKTALKDLTITASLDALFHDSLGADGAGRLVDSLAFTLVQDVATKQRLLEELNPLKRGEYLMRELVLLAKMLENQRPHGDKEWPPAYSPN